MAARRQIVAMGGGGFYTEPQNPLLEDYLLGLTGADRAKICFVPTASGDSLRYTLRFYEAFSGGRADPSHLPLHCAPRTDIREHLLAQDVIMVGGGNTANMLAVWRIHGVDGYLREAWEQGVVLCGWSAGMICWFEAGVTDSFGPLAALNDGLGFLPGSACPHYHGEADRIPTYRRLIAGGFPAGYAADDSAGFHFLGRELSACVCSRVEAACYRLELDQGEVRETRLDTRFLGPSTPSTSSG